jgi:hypothetical protein
MAILHPRTSACRSKHVQAAAIDHGWWRISRQGQHWQPQPIYASKQERVLWQASASCYKHALFAKRVPFSTPKWYDSIFFGYWIAKSEEKWLSFTSRCSKKWLMKGEASDSTWIADLIGRSRTPDYQRCEVVDLFVSVDNDHYRQTNSRSLYKFLTYDAKEPGSTLCPKYCKFCSAALIWSFNVIFISLALKSHEESGPGAPQGCSIGQ